MFRTTQRPVGSNVDFDPKNYHFGIFSAQKLYENIVATVLPPNLSYCYIHWEKTWTNFDLLSGVVLLSGIT